MATAPVLPPLYKDLIPLTVEQHGSWRMRRVDAAPFLADQTALPVTIEEFPLIQRHMPIVFSLGEDPVPLAMMGIAPGVNLFLDGEGRMIGREIYFPAYARRYPFFLAKVGDKSAKSLCFDPTSDMVGPFADGVALFDDGKPSATTREMLTFAENLDAAGALTTAFMAEVQALGLLIDGDAKFAVPGQDEPVSINGFRIVDEAKLNALDGDVLRRLAANGILPRLHAHLLSLSLIRDLLVRQLSRNRAPEPALQE